MRDGMTGVLHQAFQIQDGDMAVMVGGGGKTSLIDRLAHEYACAGKKAIIATSTKIFPPANPDCALLLVGDLRDFNHQMTGAFFRSGIVAVGRDINREGKIVGLKPEEINSIKRRSWADLILVEGDGAKGKPFKAPRFYEPVIPDEATLVVPVLGVECIGAPLTEQYFHALEQICLLTGLKHGDAVREKDLARILLDARGYKKNLPSHARWIPFINKVESGEDRNRALRLALLLKESGVDAVVIGAAGGAHPAVEVV